MNSRNLRLLKAKHIKSFEVFEKLINEINVINENYKISGVPKYWKSDSQKT